MTTLICDCNQTLPLDANALARQLPDALTRHSALCRREAGAFLQAVQGTEPVVVACTQERRLFGELATEAQAKTSVIRFVNLRETAGWSRQGPEATPKMAALLAGAHLDEPQPVPGVRFQSAGRLLIIGPIDAAENAAALLADTLDITVFTEGPGNAGGAQARHYPVLGGRLVRLDGWLGQFELTWAADNPIDLDLCTRCNACIAACPEQAIGLDYQVDLDRCGAHRDCVKACGALGAIQFEREATPQTARFDLVLDLRERSAFLRHSAPLGYLRGATPANLLRLRDWVGEFEKPRFFTYTRERCAHSRNEQVGCRACVDICSAEAIRSEASQQRIEVNPHLCVGCGACTTVCPTGALGYAHPGADELGRTLKTLLGAYRQAGGLDPVLMLHSQGAGQTLVDALGRAASLGVADGLPAHVIPVALWHTASLGLDVWLAALAYGASGIVLLSTGEEAPQYIDGLQAQMNQLQALLDGLGYGSAGRVWVQWVHASQATELDAELQRLGAAAQRPRGSLPPGSYGVAADKRSSLQLALGHLLEHAPALRGDTRPQALALPAEGALWGTVEVRTEACTLCMSCVSACPAGALLDNPQTPQLRFIEKNCVQCGLCARTCPEKAVELVPRLLLTPERTQARVLNESPAYGCVRCGKPFGTLKAVEAMLGRLAGHAMFKGAALERLKMCSDCRVIDIYSAGDEQKII